ncbi:MAG TPA: excinuclease ABC subunit UvrC, partial [Actinomycetaceae bacterium]|nr:excinuclease ABC subunit UvrC [Actinomycetaceae bacterium]
EAAETGDIAAAVPREVLVPHLPADLPEVTAWLRELRGGSVQIRVPQRGDKKALADTVHRNAEHALALHKSRRAGDLTTRSQALADLAEALDLDEAPLRIECFDISHTQGTHQVGAMVVFEDGLPRKGEYRRFIVRGADGSGARDDTEAMAEVLRRRFKHFRSARERAPENGEGPVDADGLPIRSGEVSATDGRATRFAYPPNLVVVDGGAPQVNAAQRALDELGVEDVALIGLAKRLEEVWLPGEEFPLVLPRTSPGLYLLQRVRDEAHRFAISAHRRRRSSAMTRSALDDIPGLGPVRAAALLKAFGSVRAVRKATLEEIAEVPGFGPATARAVVAALHPQDDASGRAAGPEATVEA